MTQKTKILSRSRIYSHRYEDIFSEKVLLQSGDEGEYIVSYTKEFVIIVPFLFSRDSILMLSQYRYGIRKTVLGFPGGFLENNETITDAAKRELFEETGYETEKFEHITSLYENAEKSRNKFHIVFAYNVKLSKTPKQNPDIYESETNLRIVPVNQLLKLKYIIKLASAVTIAILPFVYLKVMNILQKKSV